MRSLKVAVLGAGPAGLAIALLLARDGHKVTLLERDPMEPTAPDDAFTWEREGIPHFMHPHAFIPRGRKEMIEHLGDVHATMIRHGASDVDVGRRTPGARVAEDTDFQYICVRRPLIEWALRQAIRAERGIDVRPRTHVRGIQLDGGAVAGIDLDGGALAADVAVDAMGRRSPMRAWLEQIGHAAPLEETSDCGVIYYSRYYRVLPGRELPDGPWLLSPRGDLGYMAFASFPGDNRTFGVALAVPTGVPELKVLRHARAHEAAIAQMPVLRRWINADLVEPITPVMPMGGLRNSIQVEIDRLPTGVFPTGDALAHTDPLLAHGLSFSLIHGVEIARALRAHHDLTDARGAYLSAVMPALRERFDFATAVDEQRHRMWTGGSVDFTRRDRDYALFSMLAAGATAMADPEIFRVFVRRIGLLDSIKVLDEDERLKTRIETLFRDMRAASPPPQPPSRGEMLSLAEAAMAG